MSSREAITETTSQAAASCDSRWQARETQAAREYAESIVDTVRDPLLILNPDLSVRSANEPFYRDFQVDQQETIGRPVFELGNGQWDIPELRRLLLEVLPQSRQIRDFESSTTSSTSAAALCCSMAASSSDCS